MADGSRILTNDVVGRVYMDAKPGEYMGHDEVNGTEADFTRADTSKNPVLPTDERVDRALTSLGYSEEQPGELLRVDRAYYSNVGAQLDISRQAENAVATFSNGITSSVRVFDESAISSDVINVSTPRVAADAEMMSVMGVDNDTELIDALNTLALESAHLRDVPSYNISNVMRMFVTLYTGGKGYDTINEHLKAFNQSILGKRRAIAYQFIGRGNDRKTSFTIDELNSVVQGNFSDQSDIHNNSFIYDMLQLKNEDDKTISILYALSSVEIGVLQQLVDDRGTYNFKPLGEVDSILLKSRVDKLQILRDRVDEFSKDEMDRILKMSGFTREELDGDASGVPV